MDPEKVTPLPLRAPRPEAYKRITALIYDCIARVDVGTGMLLDELAAAGFADNTLVIFIGDNGAAVLPTANAPATNRACRCRCWCGGREGSRRDRSETSWYLPWTSCPRF